MQIKLSINRHNMVPKATDATETRFQHDFVNERSVDDGKNGDSFSPLFRQVSCV